MIIGIEFQEGRERTEFSVQPVYDKHKYYPLWQIKTLYRSHHRGELWLKAFDPVNDAALQFFVQQKHDHAHVHSEQRERASHSCQLISEYSIPCPHHEGQFNPPCRFLKRASAKKRCAVVMGSTFTSTLEPVGQMSLFKPHATHKRVWTNHTETVRIESGIKPFAKLAYPCKERAIAVMELLKRSEQYNHVNEWKIRPLRDDPQWIAQQQKRYAGRYRGCIFDEF